MEEPRVLNSDLIQSLNKCNKENKEMLRDILFLSEYILHICDISDISLRNKFLKIYKKYQGKKKNEN